MKVTFGDTVILDYDDKPILINSDESQTATHRRVVHLALTSGLMGDEKKTGKEKHELFKLAKRVKKARGPLDLLVEDVATIKERVALMFPPLVAGAMFDVIEGVEDEADEPAPKDNGVDALRNAHKIVDSLEAQFRDGLAVGAPPK